MSLVYDALKQGRAARSQSGASSGTAPATTAKESLALQPSSEATAPAPGSARPAAVPGVPRGAGLPEPGQAVAAPTAAGSWRPVIVGAAAGSLAVVALVGAFVWGQSSRAPAVPEVRVVTAPAASGDASPSTPARPAAAEAPVAPPPDPQVRTPEPAPVAAVASVPVAAVRPARSPVPVAVPSPEIARSTAPAASTATAAPALVAAAASTPSTSLTPGSPATADKGADASPRVPARPASPPRVQVSSGADSGIDVGALFQEFLIRVQASQWGEAQSTQQRVIAAMGPDHIVSLRMQAYLALRTDRLDAARVHYLKLVDRLPQDREAGMNLALIEWRQGDKDAARRRLTALSDHYPNDVDVRALMQSLRQ